MRGRLLLLFCLLFIVFSCKKEDVPFQTDNGTGNDTISNTDKVILPHIYIQVDGGNAITSKENYLQADIRIDGKGRYPDFEGRTKIRGRGNTSWNLPKKPYKLNFDDAISLLGIPDGDKWILLANYLDGSLLMNAIPYTMGQMLGLPFTNHVVPVALTLNGQDQGFYVFTEHKEVDDNRIEVGEDGLLLELDTYFDEPYEFHSDKYHLPVMVKYPELDEWTDQQKIDHQFTKIKSNFEAFENLVYDPSFPNNNYLDYFSDTAYVNYMIVYLMTDNEEINHPKSTYINKSKGGKYRMGIIWDFDWGFGYERYGKHFTLESADDPLFWDGGYHAPEAGTNFFSRFMEDPHIRELFKKRWQWFKTNKYPSLKMYVKAYAKTITPIYDKDHQIWGERDGSGDLDQDLQKVLDWLDARVDYVDSYAASL